MNTAPYDRGSAEAGGLANLGHTAQERMFRPSFAPGGLERRKHFVFETDVSGRFVSVCPASVLDQKVSDLVGVRASDVLLTPPPDLFSGECGTASRRVWVRDPCAGPFRLDVAVSPLPLGGVRGVARDASRTTVAAAVRAGRADLADAVRHILAAAASPLPAGEALGRVLETARRLLLADRLTLEATGLEVSSGGVPCGGPAAVRDAAGGRAQAPDGLAVEGSDVLVLASEAFVSACPARRDAVERRILVVRRRPGERPFDAAERDVAAATLEIALALEERLRREAGGGTQRRASTPARLLPEHLFLEELSRRRAAAIAGALLLVGVPSPSEEAMAALARSVCRLVRSSDIAARLDPAGVAVWIDGLAESVVARRSAGLSKALADAGSEGRVIRAFAVHGRDCRPARDLLDLLRAPEWEAEDPLRAPAGMA
ncbi:MAG: hypothetical protein NZM27_09035 [Acetobacteraceae bacterium]|nr:hypothetical protein [Acetobacteraceae bacterium]MDW8397994.1 hypothetical protein [Acetobacteraceae bacterium]